MKISNLNNKIKVLNCLHRSDLGGAHRRVVWVRKKLEKLDIETIILFPNKGDSRFKQWLEVEGVQHFAISIPVIRKATRVLGNLAFVLTFPFVVIRIAKIIRGNHIDLLHVNGVTNIQPVIAGALLRKPILWHWNDMLTPNWFIRLISPLLLIRHVRLAVATPFIYEQYSRAITGVNSKAYSIIPAPAPPCSTDAGNVSSLDNSKFNIPQGAKIIGFVGNLLPAKGCIDYVQIMARLCSADQSVYGFMVGGELPGYPGYSNTILAEIKKYGLESRIRMVGHQNYDVRLFLKLFDVFLFTSHSEACPIVVLEAMSEGLPVVSYSVGDVPRMLERTGLNTFEVGNLDGMVKAVQSLSTLSHEETLNLKAVIKRRVLNRYSLDSVANLHAAIYTELVSV